MDNMHVEWQRKGATLSDKTARKEFGLTQDEIVRAIRAGKLQYREGTVFGNPFLRLLRREVEALVARRHGRDSLKSKRLKAEVARVDRELCQLRVKVAALEKRRTILLRGTRS